MKSILIFVITLLSTFCFAQNFECVSIISDIECNHEVEGIEVSTMQPSIFTRWANLNESDGTNTVFRVLEWSCKTESWSRIGYLDTVGVDVFSTEPPLYILNSGQSNATPFALPFVSSAFDDYISMFDQGSQKWIDFDPTKAFLGGNSSNGGNYYAYHFAASAAAEGRIAKIVAHSWGGKEIGFWTGGNGQPQYVWAQLRDNMRDSGVDRFDVFLFYQGENDYNQTLAYWRGEFYDELYLNRLIGENNFDAQTITIVAEIAATQILSGIPRDFQNGNITTFDTDTNTYMTYAPTKDLTTSDSVHLDSNSHIILGDRMYQIYKTMPY